MDADECGTIAVMHHTDAGLAFLTKQLIAYIGNKRSLLGFLQDVFLELSEQAPIRTALDPMAGSGAVARLLRAMGVEVSANDWELYAYIVNDCHVATAPRELDGLFAAFGGIGTIIEDLNGASYTTPGYFTRHYAPRDTGTADYRTERLFYTRENALFIDGVRGEIERLFPGSDVDGDDADVDGDDAKRRRVLLSALIYEAATHANTSGVFKACHKGFGGHGKDALLRIMAPMQLEVPVLIAGPERCAAFCMDAERFVSGRSADLCYVDPPYTTHQYGSNYHVLNTVARHDAPPLDETLGDDGRLVSKAGIRPDWVRTRSAFCGKQTALEAMQNLLSHIDSRFIVVSYNTEGIIPFERLYDLLCEQGKTTVRAREYVKYRGGKQSLYRRVHNQELALVLDRNTPAVHGARRKAKRIVLENRICTQLAGTFHPERVKKSFELVPAAEAPSTAFPEAQFVKLFGHNGSSPALPTAHGYRFLDRLDPALLRTIPESELEALSQRLSACAFASRREEAEALVVMIISVSDQGLLAPLKRDLHRAVRKFAFRKYRGDFEEVVRIIEARMSEHPKRFDGFEAQLSSLKKTAKLRFEG